MLTSSTDTIEKHISLRNREHEEVENMVRRFRLIDSEFRRLAPLYPNTIVIDRDSKEFHERVGPGGHHRDGRAADVQGDPLRATSNRGD